MSEQTSEMAAAPKRRGKPGRKAGPTNAQLLAALEESNKRVASLEQAMVAQKATAPSEGSNAELIRALQELRDARPAAGMALNLPKGPQPRYVPYQGLVRAKVDCAYGGYRRGPDQSRGIVADIFTIDQPVLWSDDPFEPVEVISKGIMPDGTEITEIKVRTDVPIIDFRWRVKAEAESGRAFSQAV